jgi:hypothetical protein
MSASAQAYSKAWAPEGFSVGHGVPDLRHRRATCARRRELDAVIGQHRVDPVGRGLDEVTEEVARHACGGFLMELDEGELRRAIDGHEQVKLALLCSNLGNVDVKIADRIALKRLLAGLVAVDLRQAADPMALKAAMQG